MGEKEGRDDALPRRVGLRPLRNATTSGRQFSPPVNLPQESKLTRWVTAIMNGEKRNGVSSGVLRPCSAEPKKISSRGILFLPSSLDSRAHDDTESDQDERPGCEKVRIGSAEEETEGGATAKGENATHVCEPHGEMTILEVVQAPIHHNQTKHQVEPASAVQEGRHESPQFKVVGDPVGEEGDPVGRDELQEDGEGDGEDAADDGARKGRDLGELRRRQTRAVISKQVGRRRGRVRSARRRRRRERAAVRSCFLQYRSRALTSSMASLEAVTRRMNGEMTTETESANRRGSRAKISSLRLPSADLSAKTGSMHMQCKNTKTSPPPFSPSLTPAGPGHPRHQRRRRAPTPSAGPVPPTPFSVRGGSLPPRGPASP